MSKPIKVFKFGGASVKNADGVKNVTSIIERFKKNQMVIVVSAMGKTTDALERVVHAHAQKTGEAKNLLNDVKNAHYQIIGELFDNGDSVYDSVNDLFVAAEWVLDDEPHPNYDFMYDQIVPTGELVSTTIVAAYLNKTGLKTQWVDARDVIITDDIFREGWVQWEDTKLNVDQKVKPFLDQDAFVLTQGFIGSTKENYSTTLGREGSDYTAAILSYCLESEDMTIWKDVPGVLTADPRVFENVTKLDRLSYREAIEMTYYGAKVIHPKTIKPLQNKSIPLFVKSFINPEKDGTFIGPDVEDHYPPMVALESHQALLNISTRDFSFVAEHHMRYLFNKIAEHRLQVNLMQNTAISFAICVNHIDDRIFKFSESIQHDFKVLMDYEGLELITVRHYTPQIIEMLRNGKIIMVEERSKNTIQMVAKEVPLMKRKAVLVE